MDEKNRRIDDGWHMDKRVSISHIFTTLSLAGAIFFWGAQMDSRVSRLEYAFTIQQDKDKAQDAERIRIQQDLISRLLTIETKLDRLIEKRNGN